MVFQDLREFLAALKGRGELHEISASVDKDEEIGVICSDNSRVRGPALIFRNINRFRNPWSPASSVRSGATPWR